MTDPSTRQVALNYWRQCALAVGHLDNELPNAAALTALARHGTLGLSQEWITNGLGPWAPTLHKLIELIDGGGVNQFYDNPGPWVGVAVAAPAQQMVSQVPTVMQQQPVAQSLSPQQNHREWFRVLMEQWRRAMIDNGTSAEQLPLDSHIGKLAAAGTGILDHPRCPGRVKTWSRVILLMEQAIEDPDFDPDLYYGDRFAWIAEHPEWDPSADTGDASEQVNEPPAVDTSAAEEPAPVADTDVSAPVGSLSPESVDHGDDSASLSAVEDSAVAGDVYSSAAPEFASAESAGGYSLGSSTPSEDVPARETTAVNVPAVESDEDGAVPHLGGEQPTAGPRLGQHLNDDTDNDADAAAADAVAQPRSDTLSDEGPSAPVPAPPVMGAAHPGTPIPPAPPVGRPGEPSLGNQLSEAASQVGEKVASTLGKLRNSSSFFDSILGGDQSQAPATRPQSPGFQQTQPPQDAGDQPQAVVPPVPAAPPVVPAHTPEMPPAVPAEESTGAPTYPSEESTGAPTYPSEVSTPQSVPTASALPPVADNSVVAPEQPEDIAEPVAVHPPRNEYPRNASYTDILAGEAANLIHDDDIRQGIRREIMNVGLIFGEENTPSYAVVKGRIDSGSTSTSDHDSSEPTPAAAGPNSGRVWLTWDCPEEYYTTPVKIFCVISNDERKLFSTPRQSGDFRIATEGYAWADEHPVPFLRVYQVWMFAGDNQDSALESTPIRLGHYVCVAPVKDISAELIDTTIKVKWELAEEKLRDRIQVYAVPETALDKEKTEYLRVEQKEDSNTCQWEAESAANGQTFTIRVRRQIRLIDDRKAHNNTVDSSVDTTPYYSYEFASCDLLVSLPLKAVTIDVSQQQTSNTIAELFGEESTTDTSYVVKWDEGNPGGTVYIYRAERPIRDDGSKNFDTQSVAKDELKSIIGGEVINIDHLTEHQISFDWPNENSTDMYITPVTLGGSQAMIGKSTGIFRILDFVKPQLQYRGSEVMVVFAWPKGAEKVRAYYVQADDRAATADPAFFCTPDKQVAAIHRDDYRDLGSMMISTAELADHGSIILSSQRSTDMDDKVEGKLAELDYPGVVTVRYFIQQDQHGRCWVSIQVLSDAGRDDLDELTFNLVKNYEGLPIDNNDGEIIKVQGSKNGQLKDPSLEMSFRDTDAPDANNFCHWLVPATSIVDGAYLRVFPTLTQMPPQETNKPGPIVVLTDPDLASLECRQYWVPNQQGGQPWQQ